MVLGRMASIREEERKNRKEGKKEDKKKREKETNTWHGGSCSDGLVRITGYAGGVNHDDSDCGVGHHLVTASPAAKKSWHARP